MTTFAQYLQARMDERNWNRAQLAKSAGFNRGVVTEYLNNNVTPGADNRQKIAKALGVSVEEVNSAADGSPTRGVFELTPAREADAQTLDRSQAELVYEIIRHLAEGNRRQRRPQLTDMAVIGGGANAMAEAMGLDEGQEPEPTADEPDEEQEDYELAASHGDEGIAPDELPETT